MKKIAFLFLVLLLGCKVEVENYNSDSIKITKISKHVWQHTSYLKTASFGNVPCNGAIMEHDGKAIIFDTPVGKKATTELITWIQSELNSEIIAIVPTHFHVDCLDTLDEFHKANIESYATEKTIELAKNNKSSIPKNAFNSFKEFHLGKTKVYVSFMGEGHTKDNVITYFPLDKTLFGGCLVKSLKAPKGNLADANINEWSNTIQKIKETFPDIEFVIPGHGKSGNSELLDYTYQLFKESSI
ncbi:subclass B1 metallo-beta-lactamase [Tenacibaculum sp. MEBiC06402]|uniref:subclass B1 metallo-beta-lactamase n=1 Tax=unclassified Tenacibaculum TaxID=2635139 RepID=UPI003B9909CE